MAAKKGGLGRGLDALFYDNAESDGGVTEIKTSDIEPNKDQPRKDFDESALNDLADSIAAHGLLQPILVTPKTNGTYMIVAGERRWRASRIAGLQKVPVIIKTMESQEIDEIALIENLQREDLSPLEQAIGFKSLMDNYKMTQEQISERLGMARPTVANVLRLLSLNDDEKSALSSGTITSGHARALLSVTDNTEKRAEMLKAAINGATVRELERMASAKEKVKATAKKDKPSYYREVELAMRSELGRNVKVNPTGKGKGTLTIEFFSDEELAEIVKKLS